MKNIYFLLLVACLTFTGCVITPQGSSQYQFKAQNLRYTYENGQITENEYYTRLNELQRLEQQEQAKRQQEFFMQQQNNFFREQRLQQQLLGHYNIMRQQQIQQQLMAK